jgi:hypothetical protein
MAEVGTIQVTVEHTPLGYMYGPMANIELDGELHEVRWGTYAYEVAAGHHRLEMSYPYFIRRAGRRAVTVSVTAGQVVRVHYRVGLMRFWPGTVTIDGEPVAHRLRSGP